MLSTSYADESRPLAAGIGRRQALLALAPVVVILVLFALVPLVILLWLSLTDYSYAIAEDTGRFVGVGNYLEVLHDNRFWRCVTTGVLFVSVSVPLELAIGLVGALLVDASGRASRWLLACVILPCLLSPVTTGLLGRLLFHTEYGPIGYLLTEASLLRHQTVLGDVAWAMVAAITLDVWQWSPFVVLMAFMALRSIPKHLLVASSIDGASQSQTFRMVVLPLITPVLIVAFGIRVLDAWREFDKLFLLTGGGPASSTETLSIYIHRVAFERGDLAYAAAMTVISFAMTLLIARLIARSAARALL